VNGLGELLWVTWSSTVSCINVYYSQTCNLGILPVWK